MPRTPQEEITDSGAARRLYARSEERKSLCLPFFKKRILQKVNPVWIRPLSEWSSPSCTRSHGCHVLWPRSGPAQMFNSKIEKNPLIKLPKLRDAGEVHKLCKPAIFRASKKNRNSDRYAKPLNPEPVALDLEPACSQPQTPDLIWHNVFINKFQKVNSID